MKKLLVCLTCLMSVLAFSQSKPFKVSGKLVDEEDQSPLESATVYLERVKDSSLITYTISNKNGEFVLEEETTDQKANLYVSYVGYKTHYQSVDLSSGTVDLKTIGMGVSTNALDEIVIKSAAPVTVKKDTLEFNVSSFKTAKDATVEDLLKQLPGVEVDAEGKIKVNGKEVNKILVNGKPFFGDDPTITTKNLTKEIIDKIQVVDTKSKSEAFTGEVTDGDTKTINLTISEEKNKGVFGRLAAGAGTHERYEAAGMLNYFDNDRRVSVLAGGNNINSPGFSFGEIQKMFGNASSMSVSSNGTFTIDGRSFGGGQGITTSRMGGLNFADVIGEKTDVSTDYFYSGSTSKNESASQRENFLPDSRYFTNSNSSSDAETNSHSVNMGFDIELDSTFLVNVNPSFRYNNSRTTFNRYEDSRDGAYTLTNESTTDSYVENSGRNFSNNIEATKRYGDKGAFIRFSMDNEISNTETDDYLASETNIFGDDPDQIIRDQFTDSENKRNRFGSSITYRLPLVAKKLFLNFEYEYSRTKTEDVKTTLDRNETSGEYEDFNEALSTDFEYIDESSAPGISLSYRNDKWSGRLGGSYNFIDLQNKDFLRPELSIARKFENIQLNSYFNYRFSQKASVYMGYYLRNEPPQLSQLQPFENVSNPLNTIVGNPNLEPSDRHRVYVGYNAFDFQKRTGLYSYFGATFTNNQVVSKTTVNEEFVRETTYANVNGNYEIYGNLDYNKDVKIDSLRTIKFGIGAYGSSRRNVNFNNDVQYASKINSIAPSLSLTFTWKDVMEIRPRYRLNFTRNRYDIEAFDDRDFNYHSLNIRTALFVPKKVEWRNDIQFNYNPNIADGFQKSSWFWNSTVAYSILKDQATITLKAYDLLNQNTNARRVANQDYIEDSQSTVLQQYFMLSFSWKFNSLGKKGETSENNMFYFD